MRLMLAGHAPRRLSLGVGLIELLVAMALAAIGLLAVVGAVVSAQQVATLDKHRASAHQLGQDMVERLLAHRGTAAKAPDTAASGFLGAAYDYAASWDAQAEPAELPLFDCTNALLPCTADQLAQRDLAEWRVRTRSVLPRGSVQIHRQETGGADVWLAWADPRTIDDAGVATGLNACPAELRLSEAQQLSVRCLRLKATP